MCLEISISLSVHALSGVGPARIAATSGLVVEKVKNNNGSCLRLSAEGGCSCELLSDQADFDGPHWLLTEDGLTKVAQAVQFVGKEAKSFTFQSRWLGDSEQEPQRMKLSALLNAIRANAIPKNTPILVGSHP